MVKTPGSGRQVSLISEEFIQQAAQFLKQAHIDPGLLRRNLVVKGLNLNALRRQRFTIGTAVFQATQLCHPCARMEENLGKGGVVAMLGHGGLCAKIIESGDIAIGDTVSVLSPEAQ
jgi:MOSC domain-containing protein YiiM